MRTSGLMRPSKLRFPDRTDTTARSPAATASEMGGEQRPAVADAGGAAEADQVEPQLLQVRGEPGPFVVVHHDLRAGGQADVFTQGLAVRPFSTAFRASRPAATITDGLDVLVQEVMAAMTT